MIIISLDGITLPQPRTVETVRLAPANRVDVVLRFDEPGSGESGPNPESMDGDEFIRQNPSSAPTSDLTAAGREAGVT